MAIMVEGTTEATVVRQVIADLAALLPMVADLAARRAMAAARTMAAAGAVTAAVLIVHPAPEVAAVTRAEAVVVTRAEAEEEATPAAVDIRAAVVTINNSVMSFDMIWFLSK
jgi:hypothetical protein